MAEVKLARELNGISEKQLKLINEVLIKKGFSDAKVTIEVLGAAGDNYMSAVKRVVAEKNGHFFKIVAKIASTIPKLRDAQNIKVAFVNEDIMYTKVFPKLTQLEEAADVPENERFRYPICYGSIMEDMEEIILLEDMTDLQFTMLDKFKMLSDDTVRLVLKNFTKLHAFSFVLKKKEPKSFEDIKQKLFNLWGNDGMPGAMAPLWQATERDIISILDQDKYKKAVEGSLIQLSERYEKYRKYDNDSRFSVILHGDAWTNNFLFRVEEGKSTECRMIDFQFSRADNPVYDLSYFIFNCTDYETRKAYFYDWIDFYHSEMDKYLFYFGLRANLEYPRERLDADFKRYSKVAFAVTLILSTLIIRDSAAAEKLTDSIQEDGMNNTEAWKITNLKEESIELFKKRTCGVADSFYDFGFFGA